MKRRIAAYAAALGLAISGLVGLATPALAAPSCYEQSCNNTAVAGTNCTSGAYGIDGFKVVDGTTTLQTVDLWYSPTCHAFWGEYNQKDAGGVDLALMGISAYGGIGYSRALDTYDGFNGPGVWTTKLYNSMQSVKFCWTQQGMGGDGGDSQTAIGGCTRWR
ncbi:hypothetical protein BJ973_007880 [Actinoplanes tereljensis]|uniref:DUF2690 domain-containing protein n=1 Tax=Paractinoplanes tereljensis TaxID=571912 RepID=A0A919NSQ0_9ACTN|nr:hypothetical protein [Actinoplanes tereljensis]GIF24400.1 hypothetical protein Ate02nite_71300 [Actinoplanes tereljensis]